MDFTFILNPLQLEDLNEQFVDEVWDKEFVEYVAIPARHMRILDSLDLCKIFHGFVKNGRKWLISEEAESPQEDDKSWRSLVGVLPHRRLTAMLFSLLMHGKQTLQQDYERTCAILAARVYLFMMQVPGSQVYEVYNSQMYVACLGCFSFGPLLVAGNPHFQDYEELDLIHKQLRSLLCDLSQLCLTFDIAANQNALQETVGTLVTFAINTHYALKINQHLLSELSRLSFECVDSLISVDGADPDVGIITLAYKALLTKFVNSGSSKKETALLHASGVLYSGILLQKYKDSALPGFKAFVQHLCYSAEGLERMDVRESCMRRVSGLLTMLPLKPYRQLLSWIVKLSRNQKPQLRLFALEVISTLIMGADKALDDECAEMPVEEVTAEGEEQAAVDSVPDSHKGVARKDLLQVAVERCKDVSSTVRTKAMGILVRCVDPANEGMQSTVKEVFGEESCLMRLVELHIKDERVTVRKSAMKLLDNLLSANPALLSKDSLQLWVSMCRDSSIQVRCQAVGSLTSLLERQPCAYTADAWMDGPMHQLSDPELKVRELVLEGLNRILFGGIEAHTPGDSVRAPWLLLRSITDKNMRRHLAKACLNLSKTSKELNHRLVDKLFTHVGTANDLSCWVMLSCVAKHIPTQDVTFVVDYYSHLSAQHQMSMEGVRVQCLVLEVLCEWAGSLGAAGHELRLRSLSALREDAVSPATAKGTILLCSRLASVQGLGAQWANDLLQDSQARLLAFTSASSPPPGSLLLITADVALQAEVKPSREFVSLLMDLIRSYDPEKTDDVTVETRAAAVTAVGKLSLRDHKVATAAAPLCARLLSLPGCPLPLQINCMCVLADLCTRFTSIVEPLLSGMCCCLGSEEVCVRHMATQLVTQLLVGDFLRLRDQLYYHYFGLVCDEDERVRDIATYYIVQCMVQRKKNILYHNFVEGVYYFNGFKNPYAVSEEELKLFNFRGEEKRPSRQAIYSMMLTHMSDQQRLTLQEKLCKEALQTLEADNRENPEACDEVLGDMVWVLRRAVKHFSCKASAEDTSEPVKAISQTAMKMKLDTLEKIVSLVLQLYHQLRRLAGVLLTELIAYAGDLMKENKEEIESLLESEGDLLIEIKHLRDSSPEPQPGNPSSGRETEESSST